MPGITSPDAYWAKIRCRITTPGTGSSAAASWPVAWSAQLQLQDVPEFNGTEAPANSPHVWLHSARQRLVALVRPEPEPIEPPKADETSDESALIGGFLARVRVVPVPDSKLVDMFFTGSDAAFTAKAANTLVDEYVAQNLEVKLQSTQNMLEWLEREVAAQQQQGRAERARSRRTTAIGRTRCRSTTRTTSSCRG